MTTGTVAKRRLFLGVELPREVVGQVSQTASSLRRKGVSAGNWSAPDLYHITVLFLGETTQSDEVRFANIVQSISTQATPFAVTLHHVGAFTRNKILWIGIQRDAGQQALYQLQSELVRTVRGEMDEQFVKRLDTREYSPHLTLARKLDPGTLPVAESSGDTLLVPQSFNPITFQVTELCLFESTRFNGRLVYPVRDRYPLGKTLSE